MTMTTVSRRKNIRKLIAGAGGRILSVRFRKADGSIRLMQVQPAAAKARVKGAAASPSARKGVETRQRNNPHLMAVWDVGHGAFRTINLDTVLSITLDGTRYDLTS